MVRHVSDSGGANSSVSEDRDAMKCCSASFCALEQEQPSAAAHGAFRKRLLPWLASFATAIPAPDSATVALRDPLKDPILAGGSL
jgi:hypothetical protein